MSNLNPGRADHLDATLALGSLSGESRDRSTFPCEMTSLSILIPCLDEEETIGRLIERLHSIMPELSSTYRVDVLCIDDGSRDGTAQVISHLATRFRWLSLVRHSSNEGLGRALRTGVATSVGEVIAMLDADGTFPPESLPELLARLEEGYDIVVGSAYHPAGAVEQVEPLRLFVSRSLSRLYRFLTRSDIYSFSGIFRVYRREVFDKVKISQTGFAAVSEILLQSMSAGLRVSEVPTSLTRRQQGDSKLRFWREVRGHLRLLWHICRHRNQVVRNRSQREDQPANFLPTSTCAASTAKFKPHHASEPITRRTAEVFSQILDLNTLQLDRQRELLLSRLRRPAAVFASATCLDAGCGRGEACRAMEELGAAAVVGLDAAYRRRDFGVNGSKRGACFVQATVLAIPFPTESFDVVHCSGVLHHLADPAQGLGELVRVLRPGGLLYIAVVGHEGLQLLVTQGMRLLSRIVPLPQMSRLLQVFLPGWAVAGLLDVGYAPIRRTYSERAVRQWFFEHHFEDIQRTRSERYDYRNYWSRLWWGVGWIQLSGFKRG